jgi:hypothetical protein
VRNAAKMVQNAAKNAAKRSIPGGFCSFSASSTTAAPPPVYPRRLFALQRTWWLFSDLIPLNDALHLLQLNTGFDFAISTFVGGRTSAAKGASNTESTRTYKKKEAEGGGGTGGHGRLPRQGTICMSNKSQAGSGTLGTPPPPDRLQNWLFRNA